MAGGVQAGGPADEAGVVDADVTEPRWVRALRRVSLVIAIPAAIATFLLMAQVIVDVAGRNLFHRPFAGTLEMTQHWWMMMIVFGGLAYAQVQGEHIRATVIVEQLPAAWQRVADATSAAVLGALALVLCYGGWVEALDSFGIREATPSTPSVLIWPFVFMVPLGFLALALQCIASVATSLRGTQLGTAESVL